MLYGPAVQGWTYSWSYHGELTLGTVQCQQLGMDYAGLGLSGNGPRGSHLLRVRCEGAFLW